MQTLNLGHLQNDATLEGVVLGIVYSTESEEAGRQDLRVKRDGEREGEQRSACVRKAVDEVEEKRLMEGVMEVEGGGRVSFLVYRVD
jgi:hypothetical protein